MNAPTIAQTKTRRCVCLLGAAFNTKNMGVSALTFGAIKCALHQWPEAEILLLDYAVEPTTYQVTIVGRPIDVPLVNMRFSKKLYLANNIAWLVVLSVVLRLLPSERLRQWIIRGNRCLQAMHRADFVASLAGGDSFSDIYGLTRLLYVSLPQLLAILARKPLVLLPQTYGPFQGRMARAVARFILRRARLVYSRDSEGVESAAELIGRRLAGPKPRFCYDIGFLLDPTPKAESGIIGITGISADSCLVGVNLSGLLSGTGTGCAAQFGFKTDYDYLLARVIELLIEQKNARVLLIPHVFGSTGEGDSAVCQRVYDNLRHKYPGRIGWAAGTYNQSEIKAIIGLCDFFVGSRMHACIAALSQHIPAVSIAYSRKFIGVMQSLRVECLVADPRTMDEREILQITGSAFERRAELRFELELRIPELKRRTIELFSELDDFGPGSGSSDNVDAEGFASRACSLGSVR